MSELGRTCPNCGEPMLGITSTEEIASCPNCGKFYERHRPVGPSRWPATWKMVLALCGPMLLVVGMQVSRFAAIRLNQNALYKVMDEGLYFAVPLAWFGWPIVAGYMLSKAYAAVPDRWMTWIGLTIGGLVGNTAIMLASMLVRVVV